ncbi:uncharacterized protein LOC124878760 isoform X3 [Girardinichthys multiradiatus]|uniref:uncharacterized protein LOC124878760 isoform X3 n=1 Tax=Girardinichthys multiradiatus TaxID=208333 RepID=UPI001FADC5E3|nr:uncharacterized protein LOC124878760 isoform X3 [Girardinichthys multiradiatus]
MDSQFQDVQKVLVFKEELPGEEQYWCPRLNQEDQKPRQIKEEQDDSEIKEFVFNPDPVKNEDDDEKPQLSERHSQPEENRDSVGPEQDHDQDSFETDISDGNWEDSGDAPSCSDSVRNNKVPVGDKICEKDIQQLLVIKEELSAEEQDPSPVWNRTTRIPHSIKTNRMSLTLQSLYSILSLRRVNMMKRNLSSQNFLMVRLKRTETVLDQNQIMQTKLQMRRRTSVMDTGRRAVKLSWVQTW